jgi:tetratricopeptide (TPR) repeat protein
MMLQQAADNLSVIDQAAALLFRQRQALKPALDAYKRYIARKPSSRNAAFNYAYYLSKDGQFEAAVSMYKRALKLKVPGPEEVHLNIANIYMDHLRSPENARQHLEQSIRLNPDYASAYYNLGNLSEQQGDRDQAIACFEQYLRLDPVNDSALARLADAHQFNAKTDGLLARMAESARSSKNSDLHFSLGRVYDQLGEYELAWRHFDQANSLDRRLFPVYDRMAAESRFERIVSQCDSRWLAGFDGKSEENVFICGMFRSGSTLLEQILAAHPSFSAGGESQFFPRLVAKNLPEFPEGLGNIRKEQVSAWRRQHQRHMRQLFDGSARVTDKRPDNFLHIGLIKAVLPSARIIVTERDWRDIATSIYSTRLGAGQNYSTSLENIRHYIGLQKKMVAHWQSLLGDDLVCVRYEDLVLEPRKTIGGLLESLHEEWDDRCLDFSKLRNTVQTASVWQVREPLHSNSVQRWRNYRAEFEKTFGPAVDRMEP